MHGGEDDMRGTEAMMRESMATAWQVARRLQGRAGNRAAQTWPLPTEPALRQDFDLIHSDAAPAPLGDSAHIPGVHSEESPTEQLSPQAKDSRYCSFQGPPPTSRSEASSSCQPAEVQNISEQHSDSPAPAAAHPGQHASSELRENTSAQGRERHVPPLVLHGISRAPTNEPENRMKTAELDRAIQDSTLRAMSAADSRCPEGPR
ncbi:hypothetical protein CYMTET_56735 [Cymbomonas tetramitiformis]|uniref:Uncharacterized protein n=1 Tax=Cymbomonas tetramitiformis TaxID=36881 RepID=A0AAE0ELP1_9CHLO|nr:hypothetical protein CYMTET_56735 [Cymbomonas tetramitiformis]